MKFDFLVLLANGLPAFVILMSVPTLTDILFVWTVQPAIIAASVDIVGVLVNLVVLPILAQARTTLSAEAAHTLLVVFQAQEGLANALTNVAAFGLYSLAGILLLPACFATPTYPRILAWLGVAEWSIALFATALLMLAPALAAVPLLISFFPYAPWVWGSAWWLLRQHQ